MPLDFLDAITIYFTADEAITLGIIVLTPMMLKSLSLVLTAGLNRKKLSKIQELLNPKEVPQENTEVTASIDAVTKNLIDSQAIIEKTLNEMERQKKLFAEMREQAEISRHVASMNSEQVAALNQLLETTLNRQEQKSFPKTIRWNLFFCVLSAVLGFLLGRIVPA